MPPTPSSRRSAGSPRPGCREVTLLGQTVNAYGRDLDPPTDLAALLERVDGVDGHRAHPLHDLESVQPDHRG